MANPFTVTPVASYNANPPSDDGAKTSQNRVQWGKHISKIGDPIKSAFDTSETTTNNAFAKVIGGGGIVSIASDYAVPDTDQGKLIKATAACIITTPDATSVGSPFVFAVLNNAAVDITVDGFDTQTVDGVATATVGSGSGLFLWTDGTNWFTAGQNTATRTSVVPQGRLTLVSGTPAMSSDQTAKTIIYYTPYDGNLIPIPGGSSFSIHSFTELTLTLNGTNYLASTLYDIFVALDPADATTVIIGTGPAWSVSTAGSGARGTGAGSTEIARLQGLYANVNAITLRNNTTTYSIAANSATYVGTMVIDTTNGQVSCHFGYGTSRKWAIWNAYNRLPIFLKAGDSTASWTPSGVRPARNQTANSLIILSGLLEEIYDLRYYQASRSGVDYSISAVASNLVCHIGYNSTSSGSGVAGYNAITTSNGPANFVSQNLLTMNAAYRAAPALGINVITALEDVQLAGGAPLFYGGETNMMLSAKWNG